MNLESMTADIDTTLENLMTPIYSDLLKFEPEDSQPSLLKDKLEVARKALNLAQAKLTIYKSQNKDKSPMLTLENLTLPALYSQASRHVTISISGFLSQDDDQEKSWEQLASMTHPSKTSIFALQWESLHLKDLVLTLAKIAGKIGFEIALALGSGGELSILKYLMIGTHLKDFSSLFSGAKKAAKFTG